MSENPIRDDKANLPCSKTTHDLVRSWKRGQQTYDELLRDMAEQYEPGTVGEREDADAGD